MSALLEAKPEYRAVTVMRVDWNEHSRSDIVFELEVPRRSTLIMFKDGEEVGRVVAQTTRETIEPLFEAVM